jgi:protein O-GlcNAc transferase
MGESTTYGHPYNDATSFNGWLREFLAAMAPDRGWEAINAGGISYGSQGSQAAKLGPDIAAVQYEAGLAAQLFNRFDEAIEHYRRAVALNPTHAEAHCALGVVLEDRGQLPEALAHYRLAVQYGSTKNAQRDTANLSNQKLR